MALVEDDLLLECNIAPEEACWVALVHRLDQMSLALEEVEQRELLPRPAIPGTFCVFPIYSGLRAIGASPEWHERARHPLSLRAQFSRAPSLRRTQWALKTVFRGFSFYWGADHQRLPAFRVFSTLAEPEKPVAHTQNPRARVPYGTVYGW